MDKEYKLLVKLITACGYDINQIEDIFDFDELCEDVKRRLQQSKDNNKSILKLLEDKHKECEELKSEGFTREELISLQEKDIDRYRKALEEIENNINKYFEESFYKNCRYAKGCTSACGLATNRVFNQILNIINKAKDVYKQ